MYQKLRPLRPGDAVAEGWLREQLLRSRDGMGGHLDELEPDMIHWPYLRHMTSMVWNADNNAGWGAEISGNYWHGLVSLAFALDDDGLKEKARAWVDGVLAMQEPSGYMGAYSERDNRFDDYNAWGTACGMRALWLYAEAAGREDVFDAVYRCMLWFCENWAGDRKTRYAGVYIVDQMIRCYARYGDERLLAFCLDYDRFLTEKDLYKSSKDAYAEPRLYYNANHTSAYAAQVRLPAMVYAANGDPSWLYAAENGVRKLRAKSVQETGAPCCNSEYLSPRFATSDSEYCSFTFLNESYGELAAITGDPRYGDWMEELVFNAAEGARRKDERSIAYMTSVNEIYATEISSNYCPNNHAVYAPVHPVSCCVVNSVSILPDFVRYLALTDGEGLWFNAYAPARVDFGGVRWRVDTLYPFRMTLTLRAERGAGAYPLHLKLPLWAEGFALAKNGEAVDVRPEGGWLTLAGDWREGDEITLGFEAAARAVTVDDTDAGARYPLCVRRGPLVFALHIKEKWLDRGDGDAKTPLPEGWHWWAAVPAPTDTPPRPPYENSGYAKYDIYWNLAFDPDTVARTLTLREKPVGGYVWEDPPLEVGLTAHKALYAYPPYPGKTQEPYGILQPVEGTREITLVPFGATNLRLAYFPRAEL